MTTLWTAQQLTSYIYSSPDSQLDTFNFTTSDISAGPSLGFVNNQAYSMVVSQLGQVAMIADNSDYLVNTTDGTGTVIFTMGPGTAPGDFSSSLYQSYGPDGKLYVLDYGNGRVQVLDPKNGYAAVGQFNLASGVTTANMQFAISNTGTLYFGDGTGGGTAYTSDGTYLGAFSSPASTSNHAGTPYMSVDGIGDVFVFDTTGAHEFTDSPSAPEPSSISLLLIGIAGAAIYRKRRGLKVQRTQP